MSDPTKQPKTLKQIAHEISEFTTCTCSDPTYGGMNETTWHTDDCIIHQLALFTDYLNKQKESTDV